MPMDKDKDLKKDIQEVLDEYKLTPTDKWWDQYFSLLRTYQAWPHQQEVRPASHKLKKRLAALKEHIDEEMKYYRGSGQPELFPDLFEDKYYWGIAKPDLFEDDSDIEYQEFCKNLMSLAEYLQIIKNKLDIAISTCPEGRLRKKKRARLQNLIRDLSVLLKEIDPDRFGLTYYCHDNNDPFDEESLSEKSGDYRGPLFELTQVSCRYLQINLPQNSSSLGTAIKRALEATSYSTVYKPTSAIETPQENEKEKVLEMREQNLSTREIAKDLGISKSKVSRILRRP